MNFYQNIPHMDSIHQIADPDYYQPIPADWLIAITDVENSTPAIEKGRYKDVNGVAAASITALLNLVPDQDVPFVFGGDGATVLLPPTIHDEALRTLAACRAMAHQFFDLGLRVGLIPVQDVLVAGKVLRVGRLKMSDNFYQAIITGGGLSYAEDVLKHHIQQGPIVADFSADFSGFECRWQEIPSKHEENVTLIIKALDANPIPIYQAALEQIGKLYGNSQSRHPIALDKLRVALNPAELRTEARARWGDTSLWRIFSLWLYTLGGFLLVKYRHGIWEKQKEIVRDATDSEKFDDTLRMVISGSPNQRKMLAAYLDEQAQGRHLVYGLHVSDRALMTCLVFDRFGRQVHFLDGANGGYALAAKAMKQMEKQTL